MNERNEPQRPWYRESWPWLLMLPPLASVIVGSLMLYLAIEVPDPLVVDDYSNIEDINNRQFERDRAAAALGVSADITFETGADGQVDVNVALEGSADFAPPPTLKLKLQHVANADADRRIELERSAGKYVAATTLAVGRYDLELTPADESWRLAGPVLGVPSTAHLSAAAQPGG